MASPHNVFVALTNERDGLKVEVADLSKRYHDLSSKVSQLTSERDLLTSTNARLTADRDAAKSRVEIIETREGIRGMAVQDCVPTLSAPGSDNSDAALYDRFKSADPKESAKMMADPKISAAIRRESARRIASPKSRDGLFT